MLVGELQQNVLSAKGYTSYKHFKLEGAPISQSSTKQETICRFKGVSFRDSVSGLISKLKHFQNVVGEVFLEAANRKG